MSGLADEEPNKSTTMKNKESLYLLSRVREIRVLQVQIRVMQVIQQQSDSS